ncbi:MAG: ABC transporter permease [Acidobacteriota bacterium]|nr:ABC transporter permease [Acidobacteriota bacterium]
MGYELFIALRYLRARRRQTAVSVITAIAVAGITVGVAALIIAQAMISGFRSNVQEKILQGTDHLNLLKEDNSGIENYRELAERIRQIPGVRAVSATIYAPVLLSNGGQLEQAVLKGVDISPESGGRGSEELSSITVEGNPDLRSSSDQTTSDEENSEIAAVDNIIIGRELARALGAKLNDRVTAVSVATRLTPAGLQPRPRYTQFRLTGIFSSGWYQYDAKWSYISLVAAQSLSGSGDTAGVIRMKVVDIYQVDQIAQQVKAIAGAGFVITNWQELNRPLFTALQLQHRVIIIFFALLIVIAALNIIITLTMMVIEKHKDIGILRAQGATPQAIRRIFLWQGLLIGLIGASSGLLLGLGLSWIANHYQLISIPAEIYSVSHITLKIQVLDCVWVTALAITVSVLTTLYPARTAARLAPVEALRYD